MTATAAASSITPSSSIISLTAPFTRASLALIKDALAAVNQDGIVPDPTEAHAAVLVPFCNVNNTPGVLLEVRGKLRTHAGEVRWVRRDACVVVGLTRTSAFQVGGLTR